MTPAYNPETRYKLRTAILAEAQNWRCAYCGVRCNGSGNDWNAPSREHVIPICKGGHDDWQNEIMACRLCNTGRGAMRAMHYLRWVLAWGRWKAFRAGGKRRYNIRKHKAELASAVAPSDPSAMVGIVQTELPAAFTNAVKY